ncbi:hypothetical protein CP061683_0724B, partial [Chlamydia psittaci 06-1683]
IVKACFTSTRREEKFQRIL